jgi:hypothetical protein
MYTVTAYTAYIVISLTITIFVSRTLSKNGEVYLIDGFDGNEALAKSVNHMLVVGFYLFNIGFVLLRMQAVKGIDRVDELLLYLSANIGIVMLILGIVHFFNMLIIHRFRAAQLNRKRADAEAAIWLERKSAETANL